jgi:tetratricopeptide (TPR) repeat protein
VAESSPVGHQTAGMRRLPQPVARVQSALFVGREGELAQLHQWFTTALQGTRQVGIIAGEPGIGKTALVDTFVTQVAAVEALMLGHGQCVESYGAGEPYLPVLEALGRLCRGPEGARLVSVLRQYAPSWLVQMPALLPPDEWEALQRIMGHTAQTRMLRELTEALDVFTGERSVVLVLEDLHWSDRATLEWLAYVARRPDPARLLILGTYRPVDAIVHAHLLRTVLIELRQHGQCVELVLDYLSEADVAAYLCRRFGDTQLAADLSHVLHQRTHGNPLFLIAMVDELVRQQVVREGPDGWDVRDGLERITAIVPANLRALIEIQLAHLSPDDQMLLDAASVAGVEFSAAAIAAALERAEDAVDARCTALAHQGEFLQIRGRAEWLDGTVATCYGFLHALYQDVLYQRVPAGRQTRWHARIGTRLAQGFGEDTGEMAAALAIHLVRGRLIPQAVPYLRQAGQQAGRRGAHQEAVAFYEQALQALQQLPTTPETLAQAVDVHFALHESLFPLGAFHQLFDSLRETESLAEVLGDHRRLAWVADEFAAYFRRTGAYDQAMAWAQRAATLAVTLGDSTLQAWSTLRLGQTAYFQGDYQRAGDCFRDIIVSAPESGDVSGESISLPVHARSWLVYCLTQRGEFGEGLTLGAEAVRLAEAGDFPNSHCAAHASLGRLYLVRGALQPAIPILERSLDLCRRWHNLDWFPECAASLGLAYALAGRFAEALALLEQAVEQEVSMEGGHVSISLPELSQGYLLAGRLKEARAQAERALVLARERQERGFQAWALQLLGEIAVQCDPLDVEKAETFYRQALVLAEELGMRPVQAHCHLGLGVLYAKLDRREQAHTALSAAIELYRAMGMTFWQPQAEAAMPSLYSPPS